MLNLKLKMDGIKAAACKAQLSLILSYYLRVHHNQTFKTLANIIIFSMVHMNSFVKINSKM